FSGRLDEDLDTRLQRVRRIRKLQVSPSPTKKTSKDRREGCPQLRENLAQLLRGLLIEPGDYGAQLPLRLKEVVSLLPEKRMSLFDFLVLFDAQIGRAHV